MILKANSPESYFPVCNLEIIPVEGSSVQSEAVLYGELKYVQTIRTGGWSNFLLRVTPRQHGKDHTVENLSPSVCSYDVESGVFTKLTGGTGYARVTSGGCSRVLRMDFSSPQYTTLSWEGYEGTSVASVIGNSILGLLDNSKDAEYYTGYNPYTGNATRNENSWFSGIDLSGSSICTDIFGIWSGANSGALITPRHYAGVNHYLNGSPDNMGPGKKIRFKANDGSMVERAVLSRVKANDIIICTLDSDVPETVPFFGIPGEWFFSPPSFGQMRQRGIGFSVTQDRRIGLVTFDAIDYNDPWNQVRTFSYGSLNVTNTLTEVAWRSHFQNMSDVTHPLHGFGKFLVESRVGDSGGMLGILVGTRPLLVSLYTGLLGGYCFNGKNAPIFNRMISDADSAAGVSTGYTVTIAPDPTPA